MNEWYNFLHISFMLWYVDGGLIYILQALIFTSFQFVHALKTNFLKA